MIVILDYEMGNVGSIQNMLRKIGVREVKISRDAGDIRAADKLIPVSYTHLNGHTSLFADMMEAIEQNRKPYVLSLIHI